MFDTLKTALFGKPTGKIAQNSTPSMNNYHMLSRGKISPFASPGPGASAIMFCIDTVFTVIIQIPSPTLEDIAFVSGDINAIGWLRLPEAPIGFLMLVLTDNAGNQWPIYGPITGSSETFQQWGNLQREDNTCLVLMVDSDTNLIASGIRSFGLPNGCLTELRKTCRQHSNTDLHKTVKLFDQKDFNAQSIWNEMTKWVYNKELDKFVEL